MACCFTFVCVCVAEETSRFRSYQSRTWALACWGCFWGCSWRSPPTAPMLCLAPPGSTKVMLTFTYLLISVYSQSSYNVMNVCITMDHYSYLLQYVSMDWGIGLTPQIIFLADDGKSSTFYLFSFQFEELLFQAAVLTLRNSLPHHKLSSYAP